MEQRGLVSWSICNDMDGYSEVQIQALLSHPITNAASSDPDSMYFDEVMKQSNWKQLIQAVVDKVSAHTKNNHLEHIIKSQVPSGIKVFPSVWARDRQKANQY